MHGKRGEKVCALTRMEAILKSRSKLVEEINSFLTDEWESKLTSKEAKRAYENLEETYADIIIAESKYLQSLKGSTENEQKELTATKMADEDLKYLKDVAEKEFLVYKHEKSKEPCVINISLNFDKDIDIEKIANELIQNLKNVSI